MGVAVADGALLVAPELHQAIAQIADGAGVEPVTFWRSLARIVERFEGRNKALLARRDELQSQLDTYYLQHQGAPLDPQEYEGFLTEIGYLVPEPDPFKISTSNVDPELAKIAGPQLVCPVDNARFALNAANSRWGSLLDALYGTDAVPGDRGGPYNHERGAVVFQVAEAFLDETFALERPRFAVSRAKFGEVRSFRVITKGQDGAKRLAFTLEDGSEVGLANGNQFVGYAGDDAAPSSVLLCHNELHVEIQIDPTDEIGKTHAAGIKDIILESAVTTIMDCEDSVAAVDAADKALVYGNWAAMIRGDLSAPLVKNGESIKRTLSPDKTFKSAHGAAATLRLPGRSVLLVRNVGIHMYTDAVTKGNGSPVPEGLLDALATVMASLPDLAETGARPFSNSRTGSVYVVKPKMHGPEEVAYVAETFGAVEEALGLPQNTIKMGIMDEERRTTINLAACIKAAADRVVFINTGFLDRTGDEIHTSMEAGPFLPKAEIKGQPWLGAYEDANVDTGLAVGMQGVAQIGKGMWAMPDDMAGMIAEKIGHPKAGATTAWVPSPTAATLHAMHYHKVSVAERQAAISGGGKRASVSTILVPPVMSTERATSLNADEISREIDNNSQGILGYVVRWVDQGVGCSKVPDIQNVALMEDRATLRISSQHMANWLHHGIVTEEQVMASLKKMAAVVDGQNASDKLYQPLAPAFEERVAFQAAVELVFGGRDAANGYTEDTLTKYRTTAKAAASAADAPAVAVTSTSKL